MEGTLFDFQRNLTFIHYSSFGGGKPLRVSERALLFTFLMLLGGSEIGSKRKHSQMPMNQGKRMFTNLGHLQCKMNNS